jgi:hypothetical protein
MRDVGGFDDISVTIEADRGCGHAIASRHSSWTMPLTASAPGESASADDGTTMHGTARTQNAQYGDSRSK